MKSLSFLLATALIAPMASAQTASTIQIRCTVSDLAKPIPESTIFNQLYNLKFGGNQTLTSYKGHEYAIFIDDVTGGNSSPRYELMISMRDAKTHAILGSASTIFNLDEPELILNDGPNVLVRCSQ